MNAKSPPTLPRFGNPPVIEVVMGVEFEPLPQWDIPHFGLFWSEVNDQFPTFRVVAPLDSQIEEFDQPPKQRIQSLRLMDKPEVRCFFSDAADGTLVQIQNNRFIFNWKKNSAGETYPHYEEKIRGEFESQWNRFKEFVKRHDLGELSVVQCEISYINHIENGAGWDTPRDLQNVFSCWSGQTSGKFLPEPERVRFDVSYLIPDKRGRLRAVVVPAFRNADGKELIQFTLTARGAPRESSNAAILEWFDLGRVWVVRGFCELTTDKMHRLWQRR